MPRKIGDHWFRRNFSGLWNSFLFHNMPYCGIHYNRICNYIILWKQNLYTREKECMLWANQKTATKTDYDDVFASKFTAHISCLLRQHTVMLIHLWWYDWFSKAQQICECINPRAYIFPSGGVSVLILKNFSAKTTYYLPSHFLFWYINGFDAFCNISSIIHLVRQSFCTNFRKSKRSLLFVSENL